VRLEHAPPDEKHYANPLLGVQATGNSNAIRGAWKPLREAGATARTMLIAAAAKQWNVDPLSCRAQDGAVLHPAFATKDQLWNARRRRRAHADPDRRQPEGPWALQAHRHAGQAARYTGQSQRQCCLRH